MPLSASLGYKRGTLYSLNCCDCTFALYMMSTTQNQCFRADRYIFFIALIANNVCRHASKHDHAFLHLCKNNISNTWIVQGESAGGDSGGGVSASEKEEWKEEGRKEGHHGLPGRAVGRSVER